MLATLDFMFLLHTQHSRYFKPRTLVSSNVEFFNPEQYAEGFSYAFYLYHEHFGLPRFSPPINARAAKRDAYQAHLMDAAHVRAFVEMEVFIDAFDYSLALDREKRIAILAPPSSDLERAIRIGYIQDFAQAAANNRDARSVPGVSLRDFAKNVYLATEGGFLELRKRPFERFRFHLPAHPKLITALQDTGLFMEEFIEFNKASNDFLSPVEDLLQHEFAPNLRFWDIVKVQRLFNFIRLYSSHRLLDLVDSRKDLLLQSMVPTFTDDELQEILAFVVEKEKVAGIMGFLSWAPGSKTMFDVQYQPIIPTKIGRLVPTSILGCSNSLRNSFQLCRTRLYPDGTRDPLSAVLVDAFKCHTDHVRGGIAYSWKGENGELDVAALFDSRLFVVECKNSLLPTGPHELRTSYEYIHTAAEQLNRFTRAYRDTECREVLAKKLGWPISHSTQLVTCIVMSNRMLIGYRAAGHAVRSSGEFAAFLAKGEIQLGNESRCFWKGDKLTGEDVEDFIQRDITYKPVWDSLEQYSLKYLFGKYTVVKVEYVLPMLLLAKNLGFTRTAADIELLERGELSKEETDANYQVVADKTLD
jgi:hypothetical protein